MKINMLTVGHACLDIVHHVPRIPSPNNKIDSQSVQIQIGGNAANCAAALAELGANADLCTVLGSEDHPFTRILVSLLRASGIGIGHCRFDVDHPCPNSTIMVTGDGDRTIVNWQGSQIRSSIALPDDINQYSMVMGDNYRLPMVRMVFAMAEKAGIPTMLDIDGPVDDIGSIPRADYMWFSHEAWRKHRIGLPDLRNRFGSTVGVTNGGNLVNWIDKDGTVRSHQPPVIVPINTLGAGDVFRARLGIELCLGRPIEQAVRLACLSAGDHVTLKPLTRIM